MTIVNSSLTQDDLRDAIRAEMRRLHEYAQQCKPGPGEFTTVDYRKETGLTESQAAHELEAMVLAGRLTMRKPNKMKIYKFVEPAV